MVGLPTPDGQVWVNPGFVVVLKGADADKTHLVCEGTSYTVLLPPDQVAAILGGSPPAALVASP